MRVNELCKPLSLENGAVSGECCGPSRAGPVLSGRSGAVLLDSWWIEISLGFLESSGSHFAIAPGYLHVSSVEVWRPTGT